MERSMQAQALLLCFSILFFAATVQSAPSQKLEVPEKTTGPTTKSATPSKSSATTTTTTTTISAFKSTTLSVKGGNKVKSQDDALKYLFQFGYIDEKVNENKKVASNTDLRDVLERLQRFARLPVTGKLDEATLKLMNSPRCHLPDFPAPQNNKKKRFYTRAAWRKNKLTYNINDNPTSSYDMQDPNKVGQAIQTAFNDWTSVANVDAQRSRATNADIQIQFRKRDHGDGYPFDGPGTILAHGFFPEKGWLHFDDDEKWSSNFGTNLRQVATHEIGHVLGLDHSSVYGAVMYPYYSYTSNFKLTDDDIRGITSLYGSKQPTPSKFPLSFSSTTTTTTTRPPPTTTTMAKRPWWRFFFNYNK